MATDPAAPRTRRALLAAAAGTAAALAASAAVPLQAVAHDPDDVALGALNMTTSETAIVNSGGSVAFTAIADATGALSGILAASSHLAGLHAWSVTPTEIDIQDTAYTGVFGSSPEGDHTSTYGVGVWGDSPDTGVYGTGGFGVEGYGGVGVAGYAFNAAGTVGVRAQAFSNSSTALQVIGKVKFSRSGRTLMSSGTSTKTISLSGVTATSKVFAMLATSESGRYVRAVVPDAGKFKVYLNRSLSSSAKVAWFVLD